jgi:hypothetical protein
VTVFSVRAWGLVQAQLLFLAQAQVLALALQLVVWEAVLVAFS